MSSNHMKSFKMIFVAEFGTLSFNVKFPCQIKVVWKRSNESAETKLVPLTHGKAVFNQTLRLNVNMYFDTMTNKFVEKKCIFSFLIITEKGEKSAGSVTYDLAEFFHKQVRQIDNAFTLQKCPVANTTIQMKITYQQSTQTAFDTMSTANESMNTSTSVLELSDIEPHSMLSESSGIKQKSQRSDISKSETTKSEISKSGTTSKDIEGLIVNDMLSGQGLGESIKSIGSVTGKINDFVVKCSKNIKYELEEQRRKQSQLEMELQAAKQAQHTLQIQLEQERSSRLTLNLELTNLKDQSESQLQVLRRKAEQSQEKAKGAQQIVNQMESSLDAKGKSQHEMVNELTLKHEGILSRIRKELEQAQSKLVKEKKDRNEANSRCEKLEAELRDLRGNYQSVKQKQISLNQEITRRERELEETRINIERAYQNMVESLGNLK